jgi:putative transposase
MRYSIEKGVVMLEGVNIGSKFHNPQGGIETIIFKDAYSYMLEEDEDKTKKHLIESDTFEKHLEQQKYIQKLTERPHLQLNEYQKADRDERLKYILTLKDLVHEQKLSPTIENTYNFLIEEVEKRHPETQASKHPAHKTIAKYWRCWVVSGFDNDSLASKRRNAPTRLNSATEAQIQHHIATLWSDSNSKLKTAHYKAYKLQVEEKSQGNPSIKVASERTFYRRLAALSEIEDKLNNPNTSQATKNQLSLTLRRRIRTYFAMQRVELDRMHVNMCLVDDETLEPTKPISLYTAIDCMTRNILGVVVDYGQGENKENVLNLIRQCYLADDNLIAKGKPVVMVMDNGSGFNNAAIWKTCKRLNITPVYTPSNQPAKKPFVESYNNVLRASFFRGMIITDSKGNKTVGFNSYKGKRTDIDNEKLEMTLQKYADIKVSDFLRLLNIFLTEYSHKIHKETKVAPIMAWNESIKRTPRPHVSYHQAKQGFHVFKEKKTNKLQGRGTVRLLGQDFFNYELKLIHMAMSKYVKKGENPDIEVFFDPFDARYVTVSFIDPITGKERDIMADNINLDIMPKMVSFDELKGFKPKSYDILQEKKHDITGYYQGKIERFYSQATRPKRSGTQPASFEENNAKELSVEERIKQSHCEKPKANREPKSFYANLKAIDDKTAPKTKAPKESMTTTPSGKKRKW